MKRSIAVRVLPWLTLPLLAIVLLCANGPATGQEEESVEPAATAKAKKVRGRLPNYYRHVVDEKQRDTIYKIQEEYATKIAAVRAQLEAITKERDEKVAAVLTAEQLKEVAELKAAAEAARKKKADQQKQKLAGDTAVAE